MAAPMPVGPGELRFACPDCGSQPGRACRSWTSGAVLDVSHGARHALLAPARG